MSETTTNSPAMQDAVDRIFRTLEDRIVAAILKNDEAHSKAYDASMQACIDVATLMRAGEPAPPEMPEDPEVFLAAYPEGATVESIRAEQEALED